MDNLNHLMLQRRGKSIVVDNLPDIEQETKNYQLNVISYDTSQNQYNPPKVVIGGLPWMVRKINANDDSHTGVILKLNGDFLVSDFTFNVPNPDYPLTLEYFKTWIDLTRQIDREDLNFLRYCYNVLFSMAKYLTENRLKRPTGDEDHKEENDQNQEPDEESKVKSVQRDVGFLKEHYENMRKKGVKSKSTPIVKRIFKEGKVKFHQAWNLINSKHPVPNRSDSNVVQVRRNARRTYRNGRENFLDKYVRPQRAILESLQKNTISKRVPS